MHDYAKIYDDYADAIFRYCYLRVSDREKAKDIMQDVFIKTWEYINRDSTEEVTNIRAFLYRSARNLIIDSYRKKKSESLDELMDSGYDIVHHGHKHIQVAIEFGEAMEFVNKLDERYREVFVMRFVENLSPKEIAELIGETENNVSVRVNRAAKKVKELINEK